MSRCSDKLRERLIIFLVEDPSEDFIRLRDYVDCQRCVSLATFTPDNLVNGFNETMATEARTKFKISKVNHLLNHSKHEIAVAQRSLIE